jgi:hypothetical protein
VWPKIFLTVQKAKELRLQFISKLLDVFGQRNIHNSWENVVDLAVYTDNGLRMVGSRKMVPCKICKIKDINCEKCQGSGKIDEGRVYKPVSVLNTNNSDYFKSIERDYYVMLLETSICNYDNHPETKLIKELIISNVNNANNLTVKKKNKHMIEQTDETCKKVELFIRRKFDKYGNINVKKITKVDRETYFIEIDTNFCMNVNRTHTSSNVYFQIKPSGICQRCFCKKESTEGRISGICKKYYSEEVKLTKNLSSCLFDNVIIKKKKQIVNYNLTNNDYLSNCKNMLMKLENDLLSS